MNFQNYNNLKENLSLNLYYKFYLLMIEAFKIFNLFVFYLNYQLDVT